jgi:hypothetical protein
MTGVPCAPWCVTRNHDGRRRGQYKNPCQLRVYSDEGRLSVAQRGGALAHHRVRRAADRYDDSVLARTSRVSRADVAVVMVDRPTLTHGAITNRVVGRSGESLGRTEQAQGVPAAVGVAQDRTFSYDHRCTLRGGRSTTKESFGPSPSHSRRVRLLPGGFRRGRRLVVPGGPLGSPMGQRRWCRESAPGPCAPVAHGFAQLVASSALSSSHSS